QKECFITQERSEGTGDKESNKNKKRRKKKTITDVLTSSEPVRGSPADLLSLLKSHHSQTRSVIEQGDPTLSESCFLNLLVILFDFFNLFIFAIFILVCPKWAKIQKQYTQTRSVVLLIICGSALRTIDLIKQAKVLKLFAKHIKVDEQIKSLSKGVTQIAVECCLLKSLRYLLELFLLLFQVKGDLLKMMDHGLIQSCREGTVKIGLF
uniref:Cms1 ribosomal small subunit homolog n=1 Tax=Sinocyclocheilus anshuiensis TaxID=1608454 RepID=A0A671PGK1_9TELE